MILVIAEHRNLRQVAQLTGATIIPATAPTASSTRSVSSRMPSRSSIRRERSLVMRSVEVLATRLPTYAPPATAKPSTNTVVAGATQRTTPAKNHNHVSCANASTVVRSRGESSAANAAGASDRQSLAGVESSTRVLAR